MGRPRKELQRYTPHQLRRLQQIESWLGRLAKMQAERPDASRVGLVLALVRAVKREDPKAAISKTTLYEWAQKYEAGGRAAILDQRGKPLTGGSFRRRNAALFARLTTAELIGEAVAWLNLIRDRLREGGG